MAGRNFDIAIHAFTSTATILGSVHFIGYRITFVFLLELAEFLLRLPHHLHRKPCSLEQTINRQRGQRIMQRDQLQCRVRISQAYQEAIKRKGIIMSMSRKGTPLIMPRVSIG